MNRFFERDLVSGHAIDVFQKNGLDSLGIMTSSTWHDDPRHLAFMLSRYKFVAKMLDGNNNVLEVGCGDAFCSRIVAQSVKSLTAIDIDPDFIRDAKLRIKEPWVYDVKVHDILESPVLGNFDSVYSLDVMEHIRQQDEHKYITNIQNSMASDGMLIIGMPSIESQAYTSDINKISHVNCKNGEGLRKLMQGYFRHVLLFSMNDEVIHTGYSKMAHYIITICIGAKCVAFPP